MSWRRRRAFVVCLALVGVVAAERVTAPPLLPAFAVVRASRPSSEAVLLDRHGALLHERRVDPNGRRLAWTPLAAVSPLLTEALLRAEDRRFHTHGGVDPIAAAGAARDALSGRVRGASTLTMQLTALLDASLRARASARGALAKLRQIRAAWALERSWSKDEILEAYLNLATWRGELVGIAAASRGLWDRAPHGLGRAESALLVALLRAPNATPDSVAARACRLADEPPMCAEIERSALALAAPPRVRPRATDAPHLATRLLVQDGPARVRTTLDATLQRRVADVLARQVAALVDRNVRDAAALVVDNASGEILAWVGGSGAVSSARHVDGVRARRQAGSTLKPFLYARAFEKRLITPATQLDDSPLDVVTALGTYRPENYDHTHRGPVPAREALASSLNVPAVRVLQLVGVDDFVAVLRGLGVAGLREPDFYGDSLALGSADVSLFELVGAYRALANGGVFTPLRVRPGPAPPGARVLSASATWLVSDALSDRGARAPTFGLESVLATRGWSAVKTGTSKDMRDNWCIGSTRRFTLGVWVGNFSGASMWDVSGIDGAAPAWLEIVESLPPGDASSPPRPAELVASAAGVLLAGTEPAPRRVGRARAPLRIAAPRDGTVLALDPDIPDARERTLFEADAPDPTATFVLNGRRLGHAAQPLLWPLERGRHTLALVAVDGTTLDSVGFRVR